MLCARGLYQPSGDRCRARLAVGEVCAMEFDHGDPCELGAVSDANNTGKCVVALPVGADCDQPWLEDVLEPRTSSAVVLAGSETERDWCCPPRSRHLGTYGIRSGCRFGINGSELC